MTDREQRGLKIAATCRIVEKNGQWVVPSQTGNGTYRVNLAPPTPFVPLCTCPDHEETGKPCKHVYAVQFVVERESHPDGSETVTKTLTVKERVVAERKTYPQCWKAYNAAQTNEKHKFQVLMHDLCQGIQEPPRTTVKGGKPRLSLADMVFAVAFKVDSTVSARRFACDLKDAQERGFIERAPHFNSVLNYLEDDRLTPILRRFVAESSLPLRGVETDFAVDSSGFTSSRFVRWFDHKYGCPRQEHDRVKVSLICGIKTNIVTAVVVDEKKGGDSPQFKPLVNVTARNFKINEVSADKAYASYDNMELVAMHGGTPFIPFRSNATAKDGGVYMKMFHYYNLNREDFLGHYHKRSNVETTFSMVKAKFGDSLRSKTDVAMVNEALCKVLCHNVCCLIQSMYELGINPVFRGKEDAAPVEVPAADDAVEAMAWI